MIWVRQFGEGFVIKGWSFEIEIPPSSDDWEEGNSFLLIYYGDEKTEYRMDGMIWDLRNKLFNFLFLRYFRYDRMKDLYTLYPFNIDNIHAHTHIYMHTHIYIFIYLVFGN